MAALQNRARGSSKVVRATANGMASMAFLALIALALASAEPLPKDDEWSLNWTSCSQGDDEVISVEVPECDKSLKSDRCALPANSYFSVNVKFIQGSLKINKSDYVMEFGPNWSRGGTGDCLYGLQCPGEHGQEQNMKYLASIGSHPSAETDITTKLWVRELGFSGNETQPDHVCVEIPTYVIY